jgi:hypothetical protein
LCTSTLVFSDWDGKRLAFIIWDASKSDRLEKIIKVAHTFIDNDMKVIENRGLKISLADVLEEPESKSYVLIAFTIEEMICIALSNLEIINSRIQLSPKLHSVILRSTFGYCPTSISLRDNSLLKSHLPGSGPQQSS